MLRSSMSATCQPRLEALETREVLNGDWFSAHLPSPSVAALARADYAHHDSINYNDMLQIYAQIEKSATVTSAEFASLSSLATNASLLKTPASVAYFETQVIGENPANSAFQYLNSKGNVVSTSLGDLQIGSSHTRLGELVNKWFLGVNEPTAATTYSAAKGSLFGSNGPVFTDVHQGEVGDCWLLSSLAEVAVQQPGLISNMFTYDCTKAINGHSVEVFTVRLFSNGAPTYVTVDTELPDGGGYYDHPANGVLWVALAEKAYAEANEADVVQTGKPGSISYGALNEGYPSWALTAITGLPASYVAINPSNAAAAFEAGQMVVFCTQNPPSQYIVASHCYAMVGYNASSNMPFKVYNPWGSSSNGWALGDNSVYGLFNANAAFISQNFATESIAGTSGSGLEPLALTPAANAIPMECKTTPIPASVTISVDSGNGPAILFNDLIGSHSNPEFNNPGLNTLVEKAPHHSEWDQGLGAVSWGIWIETTETF